MEDLLKFQKTLSRQLPGYTCTIMEPAQWAGGSVQRTQCGPFNSIVVEAVNSVSRRPALFGEWLDSAFLLVSTKGSIKINQYGRSVPIKPGEFYLMDSQASCEIEVLKRAVVASIEIDRLSVLGPSIFGERVFGKKFSGRSGVPRLLMALLSALLNDKHNYDYHEKFATTEAVLGLLALLIEHGDDQALTINIDHQAQSFRVMQKWVIANLDDSAFGVPHILAEFNLSRSSLFRMFSLWGKTPNSWMLHQRLLNSRARLSNPAFRNQSISEICFASGFNSSAHFSRSFRALFGQSPTEYRATVFSPIGKT